MNAKAPNAKSASSIAAAKVMAGVICGGHGEFCGERMAFGASQAVVVCTVTLALLGLASVMDTELGVITQLARNGAPEQSRFTVPVNPPMGVTVAV